MGELKLPTVNTVTIVGRLTRDAELKYTQSGMAICKLGVAVSDRKKGADGEWKDDPSFIDCTCFDKVAEAAGNFRKGNPVHVEGCLKQERWTDKENQNHSKISVLVNRIQRLDWDPKDSAPQAANPNAGYYGDPAPNAAPAPAQAAPEEDLPF